MFKSFLLSFVFLLIALTAGGIFLINYSRIDIISSLQGYYEEKLDEIPSTHIDYNDIQQKDIDINRDFIDQKLYSNKISSDFRQSYSVFVSNLFTLDWDFETARHYLEGSTWKEQFNLGNINLFDWYGYVEDEFEQDMSANPAFGNVQELETAYWLFEDAIENYNSAASLLGEEHKDTYKWEKIINNRVVAFWLRFITWAKICTETYKSVIEDINELLSKTYNLKSLLEDVVYEARTRWQRIDDQYLKECLNDIYDTSNQSLMEVRQIQNNLESYQEWAIERLEEWLEDPFACVADREEFLTRFNDAYANVYNSLESFNQSYTQMYNVLESKDREELRQFCEQAEEFSEELEEEMEDFSEWMEDLDEMLNPDREEPAYPEDDYQDPYMEEDEDDIFEEWRPQQEEPAPHAEDPHFEDVEEEHQTELREEMREQNRERIEEMYEKRWEEDYNPFDYIDELFQEYYWDPSDFGDYEPR